MSLDKVIKPYDGEGDVMAWLSKIELVAKLTKTADLARLIPLYLEGGALAVYLEMSTDVQEDVEKLKKGLTRAFSDSMFTAFSKLKGLRWSGESVDIYATELRKLARECGFEGEALEHVVRLAFVMGVPESVSVDLQQVEEVETVPVSDLLTRARILMANQHGGSGVAGAVMPGYSGFGAGEGKGGRGPIKCWECGGPHPVKFCKQRDVRIKCFRCGGPHIARFCKEKDERDFKREAASCQLEMVKGVLNRVPVVEVVVDKRKVLALIDTGCTRSMVVRSLSHKAAGETSVLAFDGREVRCLGYDKVKVKIGEVSVEGDVRVVETLVGGVEFIVGMDIIDRLGGVTVVGDEVKFGRTGVCGMMVCRERNPDIENKDFDAWFDGEKWTVRYKWNELGEPNLKNKVSEYSNKLTDEKRHDYEVELKRWIDDGVLVPWRGDGGLLPLMAVEQATKGKVRPVLDFRELNDHVRCHTGDDNIDICGEKLREWRQVQGEPKIVDLKSAYLQIHVTEDLWKHQLVKFRGETYCLTRLGFGLSVAPKIMTKVLRKVLEKDTVVGDGTSSYIDDIYVNTDKVKPERVVEHLERNGLRAKEPEALDGGAALGLKLNRDVDGMLTFGRANKIPDVNDRLTKKELFSICGKLVGHYPVAGWLRLACSYVKRHAEGKSWGDYAGDETKERITEIVEEVNKNDPVKGKWQVPESNRGVVWTDASDLAMGALLEIEGVVAEDGTWMRKADDYNHINVAELEAVLKGINMCVNWGLRDVTVMTDSATVEGWVKVTLSGERRVRTKGAAEILIKRRLGVLRSLVEELDLRLEIKLVRSAENKADGLTRVWKKWLVQKEDAVCLTADEVKNIHRQHHMGVERTWYLAKRVDETTPKEVVRKIVRQCEQCQRIDPAPKPHQAGQLGVSENWTRAAIDVVHYQNKPYLSLVDCGPGRFAIWREMRGESASEISKNLENIFFERGPVREVLLDNAPNFRSSEVNQLMDAWEVDLFYRAAYRASGNGIVERHHRTIKAMAERMGKSPIEAVYWYNLAPKDGQKEDSVPQKSVYQYDWKMKGHREKVEKEEPQCEVKVGEEIWVKPGDARCTSKWREGIVTRINSENNVDVDGMARHILDIRRRNGGTEEAQVDRNEEVEGEQDECQQNGRRFPSRDRNPPVWMRDYVQQ